MSDNRLSEIADILVTLTHDECADMCGTIIRSFNDLKSDGGGACTCDEHTFATTLMGWARNLVEETDV